MLTKYLVAFHILKFSGTESDANKRKLSYLQKFQVQNREHTIHQLKLEQMNLRECLSKAEEKIAQQERSVDHLNLQKRTAAAEVWLLLLQGWFWSCS